MTTGLEYPGLLLVAVACYGLLGLVSILAAENWWLDEGLVGARLSECGSFTRMLAGLTIWPVCTLIFMCDMLDYRDRLL